jgi:hypothetical protein
VKAESTTTLGSAVGLLRTAQQKGQPFGVACVSARALSSESGGGAVLREAAGARLGIAAVTGVGQNLDRSRCAAIGADLHLRTPPRQDHLEATLTELFGLAGSQANVAA